MAFGCFAGRLTAWDHGYAASSLFARNKGPAMPGSGTVCGAWPSMAWGEGGGPSPRGGVPADEWEPTGE